MIYIADVHVITFLKLLHLERHSSGNSENSVSLDNDEYTV